MASTGSRLPRFLPPDPRVEEPYLLTPQTALRLAVLGAVALLAFGVLFLRLWSLQILSGSHYRAEALDNQIRNVTIAAPRGAILDSQGRVLVTNVTSNAVVVWPAELPKGDGRDTELRQLSKILNVPFAVIRARVREHRDDPLTPVTLKVAVHRDQVDYIYEHQTQFRGVQIKQTFLRSYNSQALAAQVLGYVGEISSPELKRLRKDGYTPGDMIGKSGVEAAYDTYLRGRSGTATLRVDSLGRPKDTLAPTQDPQPGEAVRLTIDVSLQRAAERALVYGIRVAHANGRWAADGGSIVALDPNTGAVLAMASYPTYKPSVWVGRTDLAKLAPLLDNRVAKEKNFPGLNRAIANTYPPGSTFKPVTALAALQTHIVSPFQTLPCTGTYTVTTQFGSQTFRNWDPYVNEQMTMPVALARSCDTYFYRLGEDFYNLPASEGHPLQLWGSRFGIGGPTGIDIGPETRGILPTPEWRQATYTRKIDQVWKPGDSIQLAIGQKDIAVTPLQMARFYALLANGGKLVTPHVVADVELPGDRGSAPTVLRSFQPPAPQPSGVDPTALAVVRDGLYQATHMSYGTSAGVFANFPIPVAGKTGTAEKVVPLPGYPSDHLESQSWWCGYAPANSPTIVLCAVIENGGHGGEAAAPAALQVFQQFFHTRPSSVGSVYSD